MLDFLIAPLEFSFMQRAVVGGLLVGAVCALIGTYVVLRGLAFVGDALSHAAFPGVVIAYLLHANIYLGALVFALITALGIGLVSKRARMSYDAAIGILFAGAFALGIVLMSTLRGYTVDLFGFLFGNILAITSRDLWLVALLGGVVILTIAFCYKELLLVSFDPTVAAAMGYPVQGLNYLLLALIAVTIVLSIQAVGIILVVALLVTPASTAYLLTERFFSMMLWSVALAALTSVVGLYLSFYLNVASGASIVLVSTCLFFLVLAGRRFTPAKR